MPRSQWRWPQQTGHWPTGGTRGPREDSSTCMVETHADPALQIILITVNLALGKAITAQGWVGGKQQYYYAQDRSRTTFTVLSARPGTLHEAYRCSCCLVTPWLTVPREVLHCVRVALLVSAAHHKDTPQRDTPSSGKTTRVCIPSVKCTQSISCVA